MISSLNNTALCNELLKWQNAVSMYRVPEDNFILFEACFHRYTP